MDEERFFCRCSALLSGNPCTSPQTCLFRGKQDCIRISPRRFPLVRNASVIFTIIFKQRSIWSKAQETKRNGYRQLLFWRLLRLIAIKALHVHTIVANQAYSSSNRSHILPRSTLHICNPFLSFLRTSCAKNTNVSRISPKAQNRFHYLSVTEDIGSRAHQDSLPCPPVH